MKCSADNDGTARGKKAACERCRTKSIDCVFPTPSPVKKRRKLPPPPPTPETESKSRTTSTSISTSNSTTPSTRRSSPTYTITTTKLFEDDVIHALHRSDGSVVPGSGLNSFDDKDFADFSGSYPGSLPQNAMIGLNGDARQRFGNGYDVPLLSPYNMSSILPMEDGILDFDFSIASAGTLLGMTSPMLKGRDDCEIHNMVR